MSKIDKNKVESLIEQGFITKRKHPSLPIFILNYSQKCQYDREWNEITLQCRGLVVDEEYNIIARPFKKFFNYEECMHTPTSDFSIYEKMDGSLGILFYYKYQWIIATRGSFESEQAIKGQELLKNYNVELLNIIYPSYTWLFEIIYKENRIVCQYNFEGLVLLGAVHTETGEELDIHQLNLDKSFLFCKIYNGIKDFSKLKSLISDNEEGFVIRFSNGDRCKLKGEEYCRLHRIITGVSNVSIWEYLSEGKSFDELLDRVPDEFYSYIKHTVKELEDAYREIVSECESVYKTFDTRKETAIYFQSQKYPSVLFAMLDKKPIDKIIWRMIRPKWSKPFGNKESEK